MKHFSNRPQLGFCCQYQINLAAPGGGQFAASIVGNCQPSEKDKIFSLMGDGFSCLLVWHAPLCCFCKTDIVLLRCLPLLVMKRFSLRPRLFFCCQYQINLAAPGGGQFAASIVGNCQPSEKDKIFSLIPEAISYHLLGNPPLSQSRLTSSFCAASSSERRNGVSSR